VLRVEAQNSTCFVDRQQRVVLSEVAGDRHVREDLSDQLSI